MVSTAIPVIPVSRTVKVEDEAIMKIALSVTIGLEFGNSARYK